MVQMPPPLPPRHQDFVGIKLLCTDVDGVLTDGGLYYGADGPVMTRFHVLDGQGLTDVRKIGIKTCFVTKSDTAPIRRRARDLRIDYCLSGIEDKVHAIEGIRRELSLDWDEIAHISDDVNDIGLLRKVGLPIAVPNAVDEVLDICAFVTARAGGAGAVREVCDALVRSTRDAAHPGSA